MLKLLVWLTRAKRVLEIGCYSGYSALCMAESLEGEAAVVITVDDFSDEAQSEELVVKYLQQHPDGHKVKLIRGKGKEVLQRVVEDKEPPFDLIFIDADKESQIEVGNPGNYRRL